jgi:hypothetical protein
MLNTFITQWIGVMFLVYLGVRMGGELSSHWTVLLATMLIIPLSLACAALTQRAKRLVENLPAEELDRGAVCAGQIALVALSMVVISGTCWGPFFATMQEEEIDPMNRAFVFFWAIPSLAMIPATTSAMRLAFHGLYLQSRSD